MNQAVTDFANLKTYDEDSIDLDYFKSVIYDNYNDFINNLIQEIDNIYEAEGIIVNNADRFVIEIFNIPTDFGPITDIIRSIIIENEIENEEQFQEIVTNNDMDINSLMANGMAYVDNNVYSNRHFILRYQLDIDEYTDFLAEE
ncbi:hypothetical protein [Staphylococcus saprophyticus]|uniref:hypothetical protein n=1 Tax=Staphylococcus saprophyticus TaxID=29385 RepID=UPI0034C68AC3